MQTPSFLVFSLYSVLVTQMNQWETITLPKWKRVLIKLYLQTSGKLDWWSLASAKGLSRTFLTSVLKAPAVENSPHLSNLALAAKRGLSD